MKHFTIILFSVFAINSCYSQQLFIESGSCSSSFHYLNSNGEALNNLQSKSQNVLQIGVRMPGFTDRLNYAVTASYTGYGAIGSDSLYNNYMEWDLNYVQLHAGLDFRVFNLGQNEFIIKANSSFGYLIQGTQILNNDVYDLVGQEEFKNMLFSLVMGFSINRLVSEDITIYAQFLNGIGDPLGVKRSSPEERLRLKSNTISFGLLVPINREKS